MFTTTRSWLMRGAAALALTCGPLVSAAFAADLALIIDNGGSATDDDLALLGVVFNARGYEVYVREDASRDDIAAALREVAARVSGADRLILVYVGDTLSRGSHTWLMPDGYEGQGWVDAAIAGVPLDVLLEMAAMLPGRAAVVVGSLDTDAPSGAPQGLAVSAGVGEVDVPQGVVLVTGPAKQAAAVVRNGLLGQDRTVADGLETLPRGVTAHGFLSPDARFAASAAETSPAAAPKPPTEPVVVTPIRPSDNAEAAEAALSLDLAERRRIQERLTVLGHSTRGIDGIFGPGTRGAIGEWQGSQNLEPTGYLNRDQLRLLTSLAETRTAELAAEAERTRQAEEAADAEFWRTTGSNGTAVDLRTYLERYPDGVYAAEARADLDRLEANARADAATEDRAAWERAEGANTVDAYRAYLGTFPQGAFAGQADARIAALSAEPERARADKAAAQAENDLGLGQGSKALIEGQLASLGYAVGEADGTFDADTRRGLREFQTRQGLEVSGYVNQETVQALIVASLGLR